MKGTTDLRLLQSSLRLAGSVVALLGEAPDAGQLPRQLLVFSDLLLEAPGGHEHYNRGTRTLQQGDTNITASCQALLQLGPCLG